MDQNVIIGIVVIIIILSLCCGIVSSSISSGVLFMNSDLELASMLPDDPDSINPNSECGLKLNNGSCDDKGAQSPLMVARKGGQKYTVDIDTPPDDWEWGSQDGDSVDIMGSCRNIQINNVDSSDFQLSLPSHYSDDWECRNFDSSLENNVRSVSFGYGEPRDPDDYTECKITINKKLCPVDNSEIMRDSLRESTSSNELIATSDQGRQIIDIDNLSRSGQHAPQHFNGGSWDDQGGKSIDVKGDCRDIIVKRCKGGIFDGCDSDTAPYIINPPPQTDWWCKNLPDNIRENVGEVSWQAAVPKNLRRKLEEAAEAKGTTLRSDCSSMHWRPHRVYSCDHGTTNCNTSIDDWGYLCVHVSHPKALPRTGHALKGSGCTFMKDDERGGAMAVCANHTPVYGGGR
tara:strand:+ start:826 stop:2031 length:1206 start_codon:yes stop_codon:yes gene_type:complete